MHTLTLATGQTVPRVGVGCWAIGGAMYAGDTPLNYAGADDTESLAGLELAYDMGARLFDTAAVYGGGHSERLVGQSVARHPDAVIVTKFGASADPDTRQVNLPDATPQGIRTSIDTSRSHLRRDRIDLVLFHLNDYPAADAAPVFDTLDALLAEGKIASYGWSTDYPASAEAFAGRPGFTTVEHDLNVLMPARDMLRLCERHNLIALSRLPLAMGLLTGKFTAASRLPPDDLRAQALDWMKAFKDGKPSPEFLKRIDAIRDVLTGNGRTLAQGALGWILAVSPRTLPVPGFKTRAQVADNIGALQKGPLPQAAMSEIERILGRG
jgi:aryl-alcohol dehydrogenase-like predicted oxidoreductase